MTEMLIFAGILFLLGLWIVLDDLSFRRKRRWTRAKVLSSVREETLVNLGQGSDGRFKTRKHVAWKIRFEFEVAGKRYENVGELPSEPGKFVSAWYDRDVPEKARLFASKVEFGWILIVTSLIPLGFWLLDVFEILR